MAPPAKLELTGPSPYGENVRTCPWTGDFNPMCPDQTKPEVSSARDYLFRSVEEYGTKNALGWVTAAGEAYQWWTYSRLGELVRAGRAALYAAGLSQGDSVGIYARNCAQWVVAQYATLCAGMVPVPIYDTLGPNIVEYVCNHASVRVVFTSADNFGKFDEARSAGKIPTVTKTVVITHGDVVPEAAVDACVSPSGGDGSIVSMVDFIAQGMELEKSQPVTEPELTSDDVFVIMYTSGTTGDPKGVVLTQRNFISSVSSALFFFKTLGFPFTAGRDVHFSYLPLAHIFEEQVVALHLSVGCAVGFYSGNIKALVDDLGSLRPTRFIGVPRVYARFQQRIQENVDSSSFIKRTLFNYAYKSQLHAVHNPMTAARIGLWDKLVFNKVRDRLLPRADFALTGAAPMSAQTNDYLKTCLNIPVAQGYGLTETVGGMTCSYIGRSVSGNVGGPLPGAHIKLADLPDMGYLSTDKPHPRGEVCVRGDFVFARYHNNEDATAAAFDADGFFRTGDVGQWLPDGSLQIIDRAKNIFKLAQGEYVSPDPLEQEYAKCKLIGQIFVYGNSLQATLVAAIVPDVPAVNAWKEKHGMQEAKLDDVVKMDQFKKDTLQELAEMRAEAKLKKYEAITDCIFDVSDINDLGQGFHVDNNLMTPSFKLKRPQLKARYGMLLDQLYEKASA